MGNTTLITLNQPAATKNNIYYINNIIFGTLQFSKAKVPSDFSFNKIKRGMFRNT